MNKYLPDLTLTSHEMIDGPGVEKRPWLLCAKPQRSNPQAERVIMACWLVSEGSIAKFWTSLDTDQFELNLNNLGIAGELLLPTAINHAEALLRGEREPELCEWKEVEIEAALIKRIAKTSEENRINLERQLEDLLRLFSPNCDAAHRVALADIMRQLRRIVPGTTPIRQQ